jgi:hypothetical protein
MLYNWGRVISSVMSPGVSSGPWFQSSTAVLSSTASTTSPIQDPGLLAASSQPGLSGKGMSSDITAWCRDCQGCGRGKVTSQSAAPVQPIPIPSPCFTHIHVDLVGPLPASSAGFNYIFTMIDRSMRWLEAVPLKDISATSCADNFVAMWFTDLACQNASPWTIDHNSPHRYGPSFMPGWAFLTTSQQTFTHKVTEWWKGRKGS